MHRFCVQKGIELKSFQRNKNTGERVIQELQNFLCNNPVKVFWYSDNKLINN